MKELKNWLYEQLFSNFCCAKYREVCIFANWILTYEDTERKVIYGE